MTRRGSIGGPVGIVEAGYDAINGRVQWITARKGPAPGAAGKGMRR